MRALLIVSVIYMFLLTAGQNSENQNECRISDRKEHLRQLVIFWKELRLSAALGRKYQRRVYLGPGGEMYALMIYPQATSYGCWVQDFRKGSKCYVKGACLFDEKAPSDFTLEDIGKNPKSKNDQGCTYKQPATYRHFLCYFKESPQA